MIPLLRYFVGWLVDAFRYREDLILENLGPSSTAVGSSCPATAASTGLSRQGVLGRSTRVRGVPLRGSLPSITTMPSAMTK